MADKTIIWPATGGGAASGQGEVVITDAAIITEIIKNSNWDVNGDYTGSIIGLVSGNIHYDNNYNMKYVFDSTTLRRFAYNQLI